MVTVCMMALAGVGIEVVCNIAEDFGFEGLRGVQKIMMALVDARVEVV